MAYVSAKNGFDDPKSSYRHTVDENGVHHVSGVYYLNNVAFRFSLNEQKKAIGCAAASLLSLHPAGGC